MLLFCNQLKRIHKSVIAVCLQKTLSNLNEYFQPMNGHLALLFILSMQMIHSLGQVRLYDYVLVLPQQTLAYD